MSSIEQSFEKLRVGRQSALKWYTGAWANLLPRKQPLKLCEHTSRNWEGVQIPVPEDVFSAYKTCIEDGHVIECTEKPHVVLISGSDGDDLAGIQKTILAANITTDDVTLHGYPYMVCQSDTAVLCVKVASPKLEALRTDLVKSHLNSTRQLRIPLYIKVCEFTSLGKLKEEYAKDIRRGYSTMKADEQKNDDVSIIDKLASELSCLTEVVTKHSKLIDVLAAQVIRLVDHAEQTDTTADIIKLDKTPKS